MIMLWGHNMPNDNFECTFDGNCLWTCCVIKKHDGFKKCEYLHISSYVDDEKRG